MYLLFGVFPDLFLPGFCLVFSWGKEGLRYTITKGDQRCVADYLCSVYHCVMQVQFLYFPQYLKYFFPLKLLVVSVYIDSQVVSEVAEKLKLKLYFCTQSLWWFSVRSITMFFHHKYRFFGRVFKDNNCVLVHCLRRIKFSSALLLFLLVIATD